jgi:integrase
MGKLTANGVKAALGKPGVHQDGDGLFLKVDRRGGASWKLRVQHEGERRDYSIGSAKLVTLAEARAKASDYRRAVRVEGRDPLAEKRRIKAAVITFREAALALIEAHKHQWANEKHESQWLATLETYAFPKLGALPVGKIEAVDVIAAIASVWTEKPETGRRVRQRICAVLDYSHARGWRATEAPVRSLAAGRGLPRQPPRDSHRLAMPYAELPAFLMRLRASGGVWGRLALEFTILTAARSCETRGAVWDEFDLEAQLWTVPASRMKARREHVVPLSPQAVRVLESAKSVLMADTELVFPGAGGVQMSNMAMLAVLRRAKEPFHVHGFRSSFRDWVAEETNFSGEVAEAALAHRVADKVEAAYRRGNLLEKRRKLMDAWGAYCDSGFGKMFRLKRSFAR